MSQTHNRIAAYHWYLGSAFWRERREPPLPHPFWIAATRSPAGHPPVSNQYCDPPHPLELL
ncbi:MAG: hypothetical protein WA309_14705, partial [Pseudolabrys sp.]